MKKNGYLRVIGAHQLSKDGHFEREKGVCAIFKEEKEKVTEKLQKSPIKDINPFAFLLYQGLMRTCKFYYYYYFIEPCFFSVDLGRLEFRTEKVRCVIMAYVVA